jgi:hypothetical protein
MRPMATPAEDPDLVAIKKAQRKAILDKLSYVGLAILAIGIFVIRGWGKVRGELEEGGLTDVEVSMKTPIEFSFKGKKNGMECSGTVTRLPFSMTKNESCVGSKGGDVGTSTSR